MRPVTHIIGIGVALLLANSVAAAPVGYSVNADEPNGDNLYAIDLATGETTFRGLVQAPTGVRSDIEGLAFDSFGVLWALDDESLTLFPINRGNGLVVVENETGVSGLGSLSGNDFGMTFSCSGELFVSSVADQSLYLLSLDGTATRIGSLGQRISAIAAYGNPTMLYGLGNGLLGEDGQEDSRSLFSIDPATGATTLIGEIGSAAGAYFEAGLSFDDSGQLWAITDRGTPDEKLPSEILRLDTGTGLATRVASTRITGFESLAVAAPAGCNVVPPEPPPGEPVDDYVGIPTLDQFGRLAAILLLLMGGMLALHRRS